MKLVFLSALLSSTAIMCVSASAQGQQAQQGGSQAQAQAQRQDVPARELINSQVMSTQGQTLGTVIGIVRRGNNQFFVIEKEQDRSQVVLPISNAWVRGERLMTRTTQDGRLQGAQPYGPDQRAQYEALPLQKQVEARTRRQQQGQGNQQQQQQQQAQQDQQQQGQQGQQRMAQADQGGQLRGPRIQVEQQPAQVQIQRQPPEIIVRQPPPTITVQQQQPQITVRMPEPDVAVQQPSPQVQIERGEPMVRSEPAQAMVTSEEVQPKIRFERTGEPQVNFQEEQGQPRIRIERMAEGQQQRQQAQRQQDQQQSTQQQFAQQDEASQQETREAFGVGQSEPATGPQQPVLVSEIKGREVYNFRGEELGSVDRVLQNAQNQRYFVVLAHGGFLGLGESESIMPLERLVMRGDRLIVQGVTESDLENMRNPQGTGYRQVGEMQQVRITETN